MKVNYFRSIRSELQDIIVGAVSSDKLVQNVSLTSEELNLLQKELEKDNGSHLVGGMLWAHEGEMHTCLSEAVRAGYPLKYMGLPLVLEGK